MKRIFIVFIFICIVLSSLAAQEANKITFDGKSFIYEGESFTTIILSTSVRLNIKSNEVTEIIYNQINGINLLTIKANNKKYAVNLSAVKFFICDSKGKSIEFLM